MLRSSLALVLSALAGLLAGIGLSSCGGGDEASTTTAPAGPTATATATLDEDRLSRAEFVAKADAICGRQLRKLYQGPQPTSFRELAAAMDKGASVLRTTVREIRALQPPKEDQQLVDEMLAAFEANAATLSDVKAAALNQDQTGVNAAVAAGEAPALRAGELAFELGLTVCSQPG